jgi:hypothetical protein
VINDHRGPNWEWARIGYELGLDSGAEVICYVQDDVLVHPEFVRIVETMAHRDQIVAFHSHHPRAHMVQTPWYTTPDDLVGTAFAVPRDVLLDHVRWLDRELVDARNVTEDTAWCMYAMYRGRRIYSPTVSPIDIDLSYASTYGNDNHMGRRPWLSWIGSPHLFADLSRPEATALGRYFQGNHWRLMTQVLPIKSQISYDLEREGP